MVASAIATTRQTMQKQEEMEDRAEDREKREEKERMVKLLAYREKAMHNSLRAFLCGCVLFAVRHNIQYIELFMSSNVPSVVRWVMPVDEITYWLVRCVLLLSLLTAIVLLGYLHVDFRLAVGTLALSYIMFVSDDRFVSSLLTYLPLLACMGALCTSVHIYYTTLSAAVTTHHLLLELPCNIVFPLASLCSAYGYFYCL